MKHSSFLRIAGLLAIILALAACSQPTDSGDTSAPAPAQMASSSNIDYTKLNPNDVVATVTGDVVDGYGRPISGATITYGTGVYSTMGDAITVSGSQPASRTINADGSFNGKFELRFDAPGLDAAFPLLPNYAKYTFWITKGGYTTRQGEVLVPTIKQVRAWISTAEENISEGYTKEIKVTDGSGTTNVVTVQYETVAASKGAWHVSLHLSKPLVIYQNIGSLAGTLLIKQNAQDDVTTAQPLANARIQLLQNDVSGPDTKDHVICETTTSATGAYTLSGTPATTINTSFQNQYLDTFYINVLTPLSMTLTELDAHTQYNSGWQKIPVPPTDLGLATTIAQPYVVVANVQPMISGWAPYSTTGAEIDPGDATTRTSLRLMFNKPMDITRSMVVKINEGAGGIDKTTFYAPILATALTWNATGTQLTVTPAVPFRKGTTIEVQPVQFFDTEGNLLNTTTTDIDLSTAGTQLLPTFVIKKGIQYLSSSYQDAWGVNQPIANDANLSLFFNVAPVSFTESKTILYETTLNTGTKIGCDISVNAATLSLVVNPNVDLKPDTTYFLSYEVVSALPGDSPLADTATGVTFKTKPAVKPTLIASNVYKYGQTPQDKFPIADNISLRFDAAITSLRTNTVELFREAGVTDILAEIVWSIDAADTTNRTITINPVKDLIYGAQYYVRYTVYGGLLDETSSTQLTTGTFTAITPDSPKLVQSTLWRNESKAPRTDFGIAESAVLTFDRAIADGTGTDPDAPLYKYDFKLYEGATVAGGTQIPISATILDATRTIATLNPDDNLKYNTQYSVYYKVYSGFYTESPTAVSIDGAFRTVKRTLATPTIARETFYEELNHAATYPNWTDSNAPTVYIALSKVDNPDHYQLQYRLSSQATTNVWTTITGVGYPVTASGLASVGSNYYYSFALPVNIPEKALDTLQIRAIAQAADAADSLPSTPIDYEDKVAPARGAFSMGPTNDTVGIADTLTLGADPVNNRTRQYVVTYTPNGTDDAAVVTFIPSAVANMTITGTQTDATTGSIAINFRIPASAVAPAATITFTVTDVHGNEVDFDAGTTGIQKYVLTVN